MRKMFFMTGGIVAPRVDRVETIGNPGEGEQGASARQGRAPPKTKEAEPRSKATKTSGM